MKVNWRMGKEGAEGVGGFCGREVGVRLVEKRKRVDEYWPMEFMEKVKKQESVIEKMRNVEFGVKMKEGKEGLMGVRLMLGLFAACFSKQGRDEELSGLLKNWLERQREKERGDFVKLMLKQEYEHYVWVLVNAIDKSVSGEWVEVMLRMYLAMRTRDEVFKALKKDLIGKKSGVKEFLDKSSDKELKDSVGLYLYGIKSIKGENRRERETKRRSSRGSEWNGN